MPDRRGTCRPRQRRGRRAGVESRNLAIISLPAGLRAAAPAGAAAWQRRLPAAQRAPAQPGLGRMPMHRQAERHDHVVDGSRTRRSSSSSTSASADGEQRADEDRQHGVQHHPRRRRRPAAALACVSTLTLLCVVWLSRLVCVQALQHGVVGALRVLDVAHQHQRLRRAPPSCAAPWCAAPRASRAARLSRWRLIVLRDADAAGDTLRVSAVEPRCAARSRLALASTHLRMVVAQPRGQLLQARLAAADVGLQAAPRSGLFSTSCSRSPCAPCACAWRLPDSADDAPAARSAATTVRSAARSRRRAARRWR